MVYISNNVVNIKLDAPALVLAYDVASASCKCGISIGYSPQMWIRNSMIERNGWRIASLHVSGCPHLFSTVNDSLCCMVYSILHVAGSNNDECFFLKTGLGRCPFDLLKPRNFAYELAGLNYLQNGRLNEIFLQW